MLISRLRRPAERKTFPNGISIIAIPSRPLFSISIVQHRRISGAQGRAACMGFASSQRRCPYHQKVKFNPNLSNNEVCFGWRVHYKANYFSFSFSLKFLSLVRMPSPQSLMLGGAAGDTTLHWESEEGTNQLSRSSFTQTTHALLFHHDWQYLEAQVLQSRQTLPLAGRKTLIIPAIGLVGRIFTIQWFQLCFVLRCQY